METAQKFAGEVIKFIVQIVVFIFAINNFVVTKIDDAVALEKRLTRIEVQLELLNRNLPKQTNFNHSSGETIMSAKFLPSAAYGMKLRETQQALGSQATPESAVEALNADEIYKDTEANRAKYGSKEPAKPAK